MLPSIFGENLFDDFFSAPFEMMPMPQERNPLYGKHAKNLMKTDVRETDDSYELDIDLPGFKKEDVDLELKDGYLVIGCGNQRLFTVLCNELLHKPELIEDPRFLTVPLRVENNKVFKVYVEEWLSDITVKDAVDMILAKGIPAGPIMDLKQISEDPHIAGARHMFVEIDHPVAGKIKLNNTPVKLSDTAADVSVPAPELGQHNVEIYTQLGYTEEELKKFAEEGVI